MTATAPISQVESHAKYRLKLLELSPSISEFDLSSIWVTPLSQYEDSIWIFPKEWFAGEPTAVGHRSINFDVIMPDGLSLTSLAHRKLLSSLNPQDVLRLSPHNGPLGHSSSISDGNAWLRGSEIG